MPKDQDAPGLCGPHACELIRLAWPILCSGALSVLDTSVNTLWVSRRLGDVAVAALANANMLWVILFAASFGISTAGSVWVARNLGQGDTLAAKAAAASMVSGSGMVSLLCVIPMMVWAVPLVECLRTPAVAATDAAQYLRVLLLSVPLTHMNGATIAALQAGGNSRSGFYCSAACVAIDGALNPLLIKGIGWVPPFGIAGSALATLVSQAAGFAGLLWWLYRTKNALCLGRGELGLLRIDTRRALALLREGGPTAIQFLWSSVEEIVMIALVNRLGAETSAAYGVIIQIWNFMLLPAAALGVATTVVLARNIGAGQFERARGLTRQGLAYGCLVSAVLVGAVELSGNQVCKLFLPTGSPALSVAGQINAHATWYLVFLGTYTVWIGALRAMGAVWAPLVISASVLAVRFPVTVALLAPWKGEAIWWGFPASGAAISALAAFHWWFRGEAVRRRLLSSTRERGLEGSGRESAWRWPGVGRSG